MRLVEAGLEFVEEAMGALFPLFKGNAIFYMYVSDAATQARILMEERHGKRQASDLTSNGSIKWPTCSTTASQVCLPLN